MIYIYILLIGLAINCIFVGMAIAFEKWYSFTFHFIAAVCFCAGIIAELSQ